MNVVKNTSTMLGLYNKLAHLSNSAIKCEPVIKLFDVTLRDGLQTQSKIYDVGEKYDIYKNIVAKYKPSSIEIGSIVNKNVLPQLGNTIELFQYIENQERHKVKPKIYVLTPTPKSLNIAMKNNILNYSFITSVSDKFQIKNTKRSLLETRKLLNEMFQLVNKNKLENKKHDIKLYLSCIDECPIGGKISLQDIVEEIMHYYVNHNKSINELCLSDTCGTLKHDRFKIIIDTLLDYYRIEPEILSLHLHVCESNLSDVSAIIQYALDKNIIKFDVSYFKNMGGCSVTMEKNQINGNLTYEQIYKICDEL